MSSLKDAKYGDLIKYSTQYGRISIVIFVEKLNLYFMSDTYRIIKDGSMMILSENAQYPLKIEILSSFENAHAY